MVFGHGNIRHLDGGHDGDDGGGGGGGGGRAATAAAVAAMAPRLGFVLQHLSVPPNQNL